MKTTTNVIDKDFLNSIYEACAFGNEEVKKKNNEGNTLLHEVLEKAFKSKFISQESVKTIEILLESKADIEAKNENGFTPLALAVQYRNAGAVDTLLKHGANPNGFQGYNQTSMAHVAMDVFHKGIFLNLLSKGMILDQEDINGYKAHSFSVYHDTNEDHFLWGLQEMDKLTKVNSSKENEKIGSNIRKYWVGLDFDEQMKSSITERYEKVCNSNSVSKDSFIKNFGQVFKETESFNQEAANVKPEFLYHGTTKIPTIDLSFLTELLESKHSSSNLESAEETSSAMTFAGDSKMPSDII